jgi:hypothetical protein
LINVFRINLAIFILIIFIESSLNHFIFADDLNSGVYPPEASPHNIGFPVWTTKWQQWLMSAPESINPAVDITGKYCSLNQNGPVWFLAGTVGGSADRTCNIPKGKDILFPIIASECDEKTFPNVKLLEDKIRCAQEDNNNVLDMKVVIDGTPLKNLERYRITSPQYNLTFPEKNMFGVAPGNTVGLSDGYWIFLQPLKPGIHTIYFSASSPENPTIGTTSFVVNVKYTINIIP